MKYLTEYVGEMLNGFVALMILLLATGFFL